MCNGCDLLTYSSLRCLAHCQRMYYWRYERGLRKRGEPEPESLSVGRTFHLAREAWQGAGWDGAYAAINKAIPLNGIDGQIFKAEERRAKVRALLRRAAELWPAGAEKVEHVFEMPIVNPRTDRSSRSFRFAGKVDEVNDEMVIDYKVTDPSRFTVTTLVDLQVPAYRDGLRACGIEISGAEYRILAQPSLKRGQPCKTRKVEEPVYMYEDRCLAWLRGDDKANSWFVPVQPGVNLTLHETLWHASKMILSLRKSGGWLPNTMACFTWNRPCEYLGLCQAASAGRNIKALMVDEYEAGDPHPELQPEPAAVAAEPGELIF